MSDIFFKLIAEQKYPDTLFAFIIYLDKFCLSL